MSLKGHVALVTGAASGIGRAVVLEFLRQGASVIGLDINSQDELVKDVHKLDFDPKEQSFLRIPIDVSNNAEVERLFQDYPPVADASILVNNAGIVRLTTSSFCTDETPAWQQTMGVNFDGARWMTEWFLRSTGHQSNRSIVFITSVHTCWGARRHEAYTASKHALLGYMRCMSGAYSEHGVRMNAVAPGFIYPTNITPGNHDPEAAYAGGKKIPLGRVGSPEEIAQVCSFLSSGAASYIHGAEIRVDGGVSIASIFDY